MSSLLLILLSAVLVCHYVPALSGMEPFRDSDEFGRAIGLCVATSLLVSLAAPLAFALGVGLDRMGLRYLHAFLTIMLIMALIPLTQRVLSRAGWRPVAPAFMRLMTVHCGILGVALIAAKSQDAVSAALYGIGTAAGFSAMLLAFTMVQRRLQTASIPGPFRDVPIAMISVGLMALGLMGLLGIVRD